MKRTKQYKSRDLGMTFDEIINTRGFEIELYEEDLRREAQRHAEEYFYDNNPSNQLMTKAHFNSVKIIDTDIPAKIIYDIAYHHKLGELLRFEQKLKQLDLLFNI